MVKRERAGARHPAAEPRARAADRARHAAHRLVRREARPARRSRACRRRSSRARRGDLRPIDAGRRARGGAAAGRRAERPARARSSAASRNQQRFLANAAHQLRTPLAGLQAHTELALAQPLPEAEPRAARAGAPARRSAPRASPTSCSRSRAPSLAARASLAPLDLKSLVEGEADAWVHQALARDIDLGFELEAAQVEGDAFLLREALANLVHNALEYSPARRPRDGAHRPARARRFPRGRGRRAGNRAGGARAACWSASTACRGPRAPAAAWASRSCARSPRPRREHCDHAMRARWRAAELR